METKEVRFAGPRSEAAWGEAFPGERLMPGQEGWWQVWGASVRDIRAGDLVLWQAGRDGDQEACLVDETFTAQAHPLRYGVVIEGERSTFGALAPIVLLRRGTHHTLAGSVR